MVFMQCTVIYSESRSGAIYWHLKLVEPLLFCTPMCLLMAATGYAVAIRCLSTAIGNVVLLGCGVGAGWALIGIITGNTIAQLNGAAPLTLNRVIQLLTLISAAFVPFAVVMCMFTRWRGVRLGFAKLPIGS